jgi:hypothetical protein
MSLGYSLCDLRQAGMVTREGLDTFAHRIVFPLDSNLYGAQHRQGLPASIPARRQGWTVWLGEGS